MRHRAGTQRNTPLRGRAEALCRSEADRDAEKKQLVHGEDHRRVVNDSDGAMESEGGGEPGPGGVRRRW